MTHAECVISSNYNWLKRDNKLYMPDQKKTKTKQNQTNGIQNNCESNENVNIRSVYLIKLQWIYVDEKFESNENDSEN